MSTASDQIAVSATNLRKTFTQGIFFRRKFEALRGMSLDVQRGEVFGLLGQNGAGKTTFIKILLGIIRNYNGSATLLGRIAGHREARRRIGYMPENLRVPRHMTGYTALSYFGGLSGMSASEIRRRSQEVLPVVGMADRAKDLVTTYSKGMMQRLGIAQALLHDPDMLIFDEPTDGLDPVARRDVRELLVELKRRGKTVFLNSHILQEVEQVCDRVAILHKGELKRVATLEEIQKHAKSAQIAVTIDIGGDLNALWRVLAHVVGQQMAPLGDGYYKVRAVLNEQSDLDKLIDDLRAEGLSILSLERKRQTLEDVFVQIVGGTYGTDQEPLIVTPVSPL
jgi:ABC-2 type transport system ATP-binding protein